MSGMHAVHKMLARCARPQRSTVTPGERLEIDTGTWQIRNLANGRTIAANPVPQFFQEMVELGGEKAYLKARIAREAAAR
jgi:hypothetical protein